MRVANRIIQNEEHIKLNASEIVVEDENNINLLNDIADRSLLQYSALMKLKNEVSGNFFMNRLHAIQNDTPNDINLDDIKYTGLYYFPTSVLTGDKPVSAGSIYMLVIGAQAGHCVQVAIDTSLVNKNIYMRNYTTSEGWGNWGTV